MNYKPEAGLIFFDKNKKHFYIEIALKEILSISRIKL
jgi:hypothetical protein